MRPILVKKIEKTKADPEGTIPFVKYHGAGNDFILIDQRETKYITTEETEKVRQLCDRHLGIGADGLMLIQYCDDFDFEMIYFNPDGSLGMFCGNGARCIVAFAKALGVIRNKARFKAADGSHFAFILEDNWVELKMGDVTDIETVENDFFLNTGTDHYVTFVEDAYQIDVNTEGKKIRNNERFKTAGVNVNFVSESENGFRIATFERGVEAETLACGTGITAAAICFAIKKEQKVRFPIKIQAKGGNLEVRFEKKEDTYSELWLCGPTKKVYDGKIIL